VIQFGSLDAAYACRDAGGRAPKVGALGDAGAIAERNPGVMTDFPGFIRFYHPAGGPSGLHPGYSRQAIFQLTIQLFPEQLVDLVRVRLALGGLHDLADEIAQQLGLAVAVLLDLFRTARQHLRDNALDGRGI